ncbi:MAG: hypothetical protein LBC41_05675 [Clostridiales bacterium]|jgi:X-X-X-Leu-X-X-Gly heptad repeat protein|nr:hypothetical protein [Clostridiales bacterium]
MKIWVKKILVAKTWVKKILAKKKRIAIKRVAAFLAVLELFSLAIPQAAFAAEKSDTIYANLGYNGEVTAIYAVNAFEEGENIVDYGEYTEVKNLSNTAPISSAGGKVTAQRADGVFYYQGVLASKTLPWNIEIERRLNGNPVTETELAGASGDFELRIRIKEGDPKAKSFYDNYFLQISLSLSKDIFTNIQAEGASVNVVGKTASISWMQAMGGESEYVLTANAKGIEMSSIQIRAASMGSLGLNLDIDGTELGEMDELVDGVATLNENTIKLADGSKEFSDGLGELSSKSGEFADSMNTLYQSAKKLDSASVAFGTGISATVAGVSTLREGVTKLNDAAKLISAGSSQYQEQLKAFATGVQTLAQASDNISQGMDSFSQKVSAIPKPNDALAAYATNLAQGEDPTQKALAMAFLEQSKALAEIQGGLGQLNGSISEFNTQMQVASASGEKIVAGYASLDSPIQQLAAGLAQLSESLESFGSSGATLESSYGQLKSGISATITALGQINTAVADELVPGIDTLAEAYEAIDEGCAKLSEAIETLDENVAKLPDEIQQKIQDFADEHLPSNDGIVSFVSTKNEVSSVLFVLQTEEIIKPATVKTTSTEERTPQTFFERFLNLFGLFKPQ